MYSDSQMRRDHASLCGILRQWAEQHLDDIERGVATDVGMEFVVAAEDGDGFAELHNMYVQAFRNARFARKGKGKGKKSGKGFLQGKGSVQGDARNCSGSRSRSRSSSQANLDCLVARIDRLEKAVVDMQAQLDKLEILALIQ